ncbi:MAG: hypothetical protein GF404_10645 [candidate division Zixibacteria bacterium]|jgi:hypothetical protein|nr:hypothetical protein [candidate division Zixibacteria bacterium]
MTETEREYKREIDRLYKQLYILSDEFERLTLMAEEEPEKLKKLHFKAYTLREKILSEWLELKSRLDD